MRAEFIIGLIVLLHVLLLYPNTPFVKSFFSFSVTDGRRRSMKYTFYHFITDGTREFMRIKNHPPTRLPYKLYRNQPTFLSPNGQFTSYVNSCIDMLSMRSSCALTVGVVVSKRHKLRKQMSYGNFFRIAKFAFIPWESRYQNGLSMSRAIAAERDSQETYSSACTFWRKILTCDVALNQWRLPCEKLWIAPPSNPPTLLDTCRSDDMSLTTSICLANLRNSWYIHSVQFYKSPL